MEYEICIALPEGYNDTTLIYPVVYMLDGYDLFGLQLQTYQQLVYHEHIPQLILVGINYSFGDKEYYSSLTDYEYIRFRDYTPTYISHQQLVEDFGEEYAGYVKESGGSGKFLRFLQEELIPFIDSEYRTDPNDRGILRLTYFFMLPKHFKKYLSVVRRCGGIMR
jgi:predicted alpha/beta superfamily hydrolase